VKLVIEAGASVGASEKLDESDLEEPQLLCGAPYLGDHALKAQYITDHERSSIAFEKTLLRKLRQLTRRFWQDVAIRHPHGFALQGC